jgi:5-methyltetrahydrofolate--homocysteine methyltransferase
MKDTEAILGNIKQNLIEGQTPQLQELVQTALNQGVDAEAILNQGLIAGMGELGELFEKKEVYVPELLLAARAMMAVMGLMEPHLIKTQSEAVKAKVVLGTVQGDIHTIGKDLVSIMLRGSGFEVIDLGVDVPPEKFVEAAKDGASLVGMSSLLVTSLPLIKTTIDALKEAGLDQVKTIAGGATVTPAFALSAGADGYAPNAAAAANKAKELLNLT